MPAVVGKAHGVDRALVAFQGGDFFARRYVPEPHGSIPAGGGEQALIGADIQTENFRGVALQFEQAPGGDQIPDLDGAIIACRGGTLAVGKERSRADGTVMIIEAVLELRRAVTVELPQVHRIVEAAGQQAMSCCRCGNRLDRTAVADEMWSGRFCRRFFAGWIGCDGRAGTERCGNGRRCDGRNGTTVTGPPVCPASIARSRDR